MKKVTVQASKTYDILIERGLLAKCGGLIAQVHPRCRVAVITDENVDKLYGDRVCNSLENAGFSPCRMVIPPGERSKSLAMLAKILDFLAQQPFQF